MQRMQDQKDVIEVRAAVTLPPGMTQEEADRLVAEADRKTREQEG